MVKTLITQDFEEKVLNNSKPVLVDFWADWCGPCRMLSPVIDKISKQLPDKADFYKVNVDEEPELAREFAIMSIPTVILFKNGEIVEQLIGVRPEAEIKAMIEREA